MNPANAIACSAGFVECRLLSVDFCLEQDRPGREVSFDLLQAIAAWTSVRPKQKRCSPLGQWIPDIHRANETTTGWFIKERHAKLATEESLTELTKIFLRVRELMYQIWLDQPQTRTKKITRKAIPELIRSNAHWLEQGNACRCCRSLHCLTRGTGLDYVIDGKS